MTLFGGLIADNRWIEIDCKTCFIRIIFPLKDKNLFYQESIILDTFLTMSSKYAPFFFHRRLDIQGN